MQIHPSRSANLFGYHPSCEVLQSRALFCWRTLFANFSMTAAVAQSMILKWHSCNICLTSTTFYYFLCALSLNAPPKLPTTQRIYQGIGYLGGCLVKNLSNWSTWSGKSCCVAGPQLVVFFHHHVIMVAFGGISKESARRMYKIVLRMIFRHCSVCVWGIVV